MRIALISDIHFGTFSDTKELAVSGEKLVNGYVQTEKPLFRDLIDVLAKEQPEYLFIAGDLTSTGSPIEFKYCYHSIYQLANAVGVDPSKTVICLGNHDIDWRISEIACCYEYENNDDNKVEYLQQEYNKLAYSWAVKIDKPVINVTPNYTYSYSTPLTGVLEYNECIVFILNSGYLCTRSHVHGGLSTSQLDWFRETVRKYDQNEKAKIVLLHHHPFNYPYPLTGLDISLLEEGSELLQICGEAGVDLVLHGHRHHPKAKTIFETNWIKPVTYICSGSLSVNSTHRLKGQIPNTFHIIDYTSSEKITLRNYSYSFASGWELNKANRVEIPVDGSMLLGKIIEEKTAIELVKELPMKQRIEYQTLRDELKYLSLEKLNELVRRVHEDTCEVYDSFPKAIMIFPHEEG